MTEFKEGDEVLVKATVTHRYGEEVEINVNGDGYVFWKGILIPASALEVNKELLEAAKKAIGYCEEISTHGSKFGVLHGPIVSYAHSIARALEDAIAAAEEGA